MQCDTLTVSKDEAAKQLEQYEEAARRNGRRVTEQDKRIMRALKIAATGGRLLEVNRAIAAAGLNRAGQPKLAMARAHVQFCEWRPRTIYSHTDPRRWVPSGGGMYYYGTRNQRISDDRVQWAVPADTFDRAATSTKDVRAYLPLIPLPLRPKHDLKNYYVLREANWHPAPPVDPYPLRPLTGSLMEIIAEWEVSPIELAAVRQAIFV